MQQVLSDLLPRQPEDVFKVLETSKQGLSQSQVGERFAQYGPNEIGKKKKARPLLIYLSKFRNPILIILIFAAVISLALHQVVDSAIIVVMVLLSTLVDFFNTFKSQRAAEKLRDQINITAAVWRDGKVQEYKVGDIVPGDVINLTAGDFVPADSYLLEGKDLFINESVLTGESVPAEKGNHNPEGRKLLMGTSVVSGWGLAIAVNTGSSTEFGKIADKLQKREEQSEFDRILKDFSSFLFRLAVFLVLAIIVINFFVGGKNMFEVFLFAVAIAVGITPEFLPMIMTANLAQGALKMSRRGVIVKQLSSIHNFGSIDVLCTDKTGTLTEDRITLIKYVDGFGKQDEDVLYYGYLSTFHLTSVQRTLDGAIQHYKKLDIQRWEKIDEIPFDFERRCDSLVVEQKGGSTSLPFLQTGDRLLISKGAPEEILAISSLYGSDGKPLDAQTSKLIYAQYEALSNDGFRVLGVAVKKVPQKNSYEKSDETEMTFLGFLGFLDPPKKTVKKALERMIQYHIDIKIVTGDNHLVTTRIAKELELPIKGIMQGSEVAALSAFELSQKVNDINIFARVDPEQKEKIIQALRANGHVVGYLGDGVNDVLSLRAADVGISVNNAVDIAKDTADIILLRKGLDEIVEGVVEGRKTFANVFKYLTMTLSSNFGNMVSMPIASIVLPFLPMTASQILLNNFIYDSSQFAIPFDHVEKEFLQKPKKFNPAFLRTFTLIFGPLSSLFDLIAFGLLYWAFGLSGGAFQAGWFLESIATQTLVVNIIRTRTSVLKTHLSFVFFASIGITAVAWILPLTPIGATFGFIMPPLYVVITMAGIVGTYLCAVELFKHVFYRRYGYLIEK